MAALTANITGTTLEIRITEIDDKTWRWLLCAIDVPHASGRENHRATWGGKRATADAAFAAAIAARRDVLADQEPKP